MSATKLQAVRNDETEDDLSFIEPFATASDPDGFVYLVSHDLRSSARALTEIPLWLREDLEKEGVQVSEDVAESFDLLERHARRLDRMLLDLLVYSRIGRLQNVMEFPMRGLIDDVVEECPLPEHVSVRIDGDLPTLSIGSRDAFVLVKCVIDNVAKHGDQNGTTLTISGERDWDSVTLTFVDDGPGVADADIQRIFRPMSMLRRRDEVEGSGMGLAIIQRIAEHYKGEVWAGSGPDGRGFCLRVRLTDAELPDKPPAAD